MASKPPFVGSALVITSGNSTGSVSAALARRGFERLKEKVALQQQTWEVHFVWKPTWDGLRPPPSAAQWARAHALPGKRALCNHWRAVEPLTTKDSFFQVMREYYAARGMDYTTRLPETFVIAPQQGKAAEAWVGWPELAAAVRRHAGQGEVLWLAKPTSENRGLGIEVLFSEAEIHDFLEKKGRAAALGVKTHWCVQKYLERPLLSPDGRKFDLRVWCVVLDTGEVLVHAPGYVRTSSDPFSLADHSRYSHLTNYCQQVHSKSFGAHEVGNTVRWETLEAWLEQVPLPGGASSGAEALWGCGQAGVWGQVLRGVCEAMDALRLRGSQRVGGMGLTENGFARRPPPHIAPTPPPPPQAASVPHDPAQHRPPAQAPGPLGSRHQYELLGLDFMITTDLACHFIEVNTNPSLDHQSGWHGQLVDTMLDRLVDVVLAAAYPEGGAWGPDPAGREVDWVGAPGGPMPEAAAAAAGGAQAAGGGGEAAAAAAAAAQQKHHKEAMAWRPRHGWHYVYNVYTSASLVPAGYVSPLAAGAGAGRSRAGSKHSGGRASSGEDAAAAAAAAAAAGGGGGGAAAPKPARASAPPLSTGSSSSAPPAAAAAAATRITPPGSPSRRTWRGAYGPKDTPGSPPTAGGGSSAAPAPAPAPAHSGHALHPRSKSVSRHPLHSSGAAADATLAALQADAAGLGGGGGGGAGASFTAAAFVPRLTAAPQRASSTPKPLSRAGSAAPSTHSHPFVAAGSRLALDAQEPLSIRGIAVGGKAAAAAAAAAPAQ